MPVILLGGVKATLISIAPEAISVASQFKRSLSEEVFGSAISRSKACSMIALASYPLWIASMSSSDKSGETINLIFPPFRIKPAIPFDSSTKAVEEKKPTARL